MEQKAINEEKNEELNLLNITREQIINNTFNKNDIYALLLENIYEKINEEKDMFSDTNINVSRPKIHHRNKKTFWENYMTNCNQIKCTNDHFNRFVEKESGLKTSLSGGNILIFKGKIDITTISDIFKKYIKNYTQCNSCKCINTKIIRDNQTRLDNLECLNSKCNATRVVQKI